MSCSCSTPTLAGRQPDIVGHLNQVYEFLGMPMLPQRFQDVCGVATKAAQAVDQAERASAIGLFNLANDRSLSEAKRQRDGAVRMLKSFKANLDERLNSTGWQEALKVINAPDPRQGNPNDLLDELAASIDDQLLKSSLSPASCQQIKQTVASSIAVGKQGIVQTMDLLGKSVVAFENQLLTGGIQTRINKLSGGIAGGVGVGGAAGGGIIANSAGEYFACTAAATVVFIAASIGCAYIPFCWCCIFPLLLAGFLAWIAACENIPR